MSKYLDDQMDQFKAGLRAITEDPVGDNQARAEARIKFEGLVSEISCVADRSMKSAHTIGGAGKFHITAAVKAIEKISRSKSPSLRELDEANAVLQKTIKSLPGRATDFNGILADKLENASGKSETIRELINDLKHKTALKALRVEGTRLF